MRSSPVSLGWPNHCQGVLQRSQVTWIQRIGCEIGGASYLLFPRKPLRGVVNGMTWPPCSIGSGAQISPVIQSIHIIRGGVRIPSQSCHAAERMLPGADPRHRDGNSSSKKFSYGRSAIADRSELPCKNHELCTVRWTLICLRFLCAKYMCITT
jgi:hypothetical protein